MHRVNLAMIGAAALALSLHAAGRVSAQVVTMDLDDGLTPQDLVDVILGESIPTSNVTYVGANSAAGIFMGGDGIIGFDLGIVLSSGSIANVAGPNTVDNITTAHGLPGDVDLDTLVPGFMTQDAAVLEFDFECETLLEISFQYVFSSDEYNEFVNSDFNDVFGFFVNGVNVALLPDAVTVVSINTVNGGNPAECDDGVDNDDDGLIDGDDPDCGVPLDGIVGEANANTQFYINNDCTDPDGGDPCPLDTEMDGLTVVLSVSAQVEPGLNHIKLAVADTTDTNFDSNVLIKAGSFKCAPPIIDCNNNGIPDDVDIAEGTSEDCNGNDVPDECDIADGPSTDLNENGIPDECEPDCNDNGIPDDVDIANGTSMDINDNGVPDECDPDCNNNGIPDDVDIADDTSMDINENGVPDECEGETEFGGAQPFEGAGSGNTEALGDLDLDGDLDVAAVIPADDPAMPGFVQVFLNQGNDGGAWQGLQAQDPVQVGHDPSSIALGDFDGDGYLDVAVTNAGDDTVSVLFNQGDGALGPPNDIAVGASPSSVVAADLDLDLDADIDLAVGNEEDQSITILLNNGDGTFTPGGGAIGPISLQLRVLAMVSDDYDDDKCPDVSGPGLGGLAPGGPQQGQVFVLLGAGGGTYEPAQYYDVGFLPTAIASGDVNGDSCSDILVTNSDSGTISILMNQCDGTFAAAIHVPVGVNPRSLSVVDLNGDMDRDVALVAIDSEIGPAIQVLDNTLETGSFGLGAPVGYGVTAPPNYIVSGDLNGDGQADLVTVNDSPGGSSTLSTLLSNVQPVSQQEAVDVKPGRCPNLLNRYSFGTLPVGLLGQDDFDVSNVDPATVRIRRKSGVGTPAFPSMGPPGPPMVIADVGAPLGSVPCICHLPPVDGVPDLTMKFNVQQVIDLLELDAVPRGVPIQIVLRGNLLDGTPFKSTDCIVMTPDPWDGGINDPPGPGSIGAVIGTLLGQWGLPGGPGDLDGDGVVGRLDLMELLGIAP